MEKITPISKKSATTDNYSGGKSQCSKIEYIYPNLKIGVIIPAYNEEKNIGKTLSKIPSNLCEKIDIIVVDDGSTDNTYQIAESYRNAIVLKHYRNRGYGAAIRTGLDLCRQDTYDVLVTLDADGQHDPRDLKKFIDPIIMGNADFVVGNRFKYYYNMNTVKKIFSKTMSVLYTILFQKRISDPTIGFRALSPRVFKNLELESNYSITQELLFKIIPTHSIFEVPIKVNERNSGNSYINLKKYLYKTAFSFIKYYIFPKIRRIFNKDLTASDLENKLKRIFKIN